MTETRRASGPFEVKLTPVASDAPAEGSPLGRMSIEKRYTGDLDAVATGEMLTVGTSVQGSAVYVAVERVAGTLHGRRGTFALHHTGVLTRGAPVLAIAVVPDSGTGALVGLAGTLRVLIEGKAHAYELDYELPEA